MTQYFTKSGDGGDGLDFTISILVVGMLVVAAVVVRDLLLPIFQIILLLMVHKKV